MSSFAFDDDEIFVGPVTQRELIFTWKKRRELKLKAGGNEYLPKVECEEMDCAVNSKQEQFQDNNVTSSESSDEQLNENFEFAAENLSGGVTPSSIEKDSSICSENKENDFEVESQVSLTEFIALQVPNNILSSSDSISSNKLASSCSSSTKSFLKAPKLTFDSSSVTTEWTKRINMSKMSQPTRPAYVQPLYNADA